MKSISPVLFALLLLTGCVSVKIESSRDAGFQKDIQKIFIVAVASRENTELYRSAMTELQLRFRERNIQTEFCLISELDLGAQKEACGKNLDAFHPDVVMEIGVGAFSNGWRSTGPTYGPNGFSGGSSSYSETTKIVVGLRDAESQKEVWKAALRVTSSLPELGGPMMAKKIVTQMEKDQLIKKNK
ncbi:MAG TPA: hypothetical protein PKL15_14260 [Saprospiraceae bacterium]|nr:hypothetical protein [Saprospiraceae bacterium]